MRHDPDRYRTDADIIVRFRHDRETIEMLARQRVIDRFADAALVWLNRASLALVLGMIALIGSGIARGVLP